MTLPKGLDLLPADYNSSWDVTLDGVWDQCTRQQSLSEIIALVGPACRLRSLLLPQSCSDRPASSATTWLDCSSWRLTQGPSRPFCANALMIVAWFPSILLQYWLASLIWAERNSAFLSLFIITTFFFSSKRKPEWDGWYFFHGVRAPEFHAAKEEICALT